MSPQSDRTLPAYKRIKLHLLNLIKTQASETRKLPSETDLAEQMGVSRMTVNRAFRELHREGYIERIAGVGSFIKEIQAESHPLEIKNIADEITLRGHQHQCKVISLKEVRADSDTANIFAIHRGSKLYHSEILHFESYHPIQLEIRYVLPALAPEYLQQDFTQYTTNQYLLDIAPQIETIEQSIYAEPPDSKMQSALNINRNEPCLVLSRKTWVNEQLMTYNLLYHPGSCYQFTSRYQPNI